MPRIFFVSNRTDGLGERLRSIVNALYLANNYSGQFVFDWRLRDGRQAAYNSICDVHELFDEDFVRKYSVDSYSHILDGAKDLDVENIADLLSSSDDSSIFKSSIPQSPVYRYLPSLKTDVVNGGFLKTFNSVAFSTGASLAISSATMVDIPEGAVAVHLRAGDVIYGIYSKSARFCSKAIPYQLAISLVQSLTSEGHPVILFGQDPALIQYLSAKYCVIAASSLLKDQLSSATHIALAEIILMSRCKQIVSGSSGFAVLASSLAGETRVPIGRYFPHADADLVLATLGNIVDQSISIEQQIFSLRWAIGQFAPILTSDQLKELCNSGLLLAPNDPFFSIVLASCHVAAGDEDDGKQLIAKVLSSNSISFNTRLLHPSSFGDKVTAEYVLKSIRTIINSEFHAYVKP